MTTVWRTASLALISALLLACSSTPDAGAVKFGSAVDKGTFQLVGAPKSSFASTDTLAYVATFTEPVNAASLRLVIAKTEGAGEQLLVDEPIALSNPASIVLADDIVLADLMPFLDGPGEYVMRFLREATPLAHGTFSIR